MMTSHTSTDIASRAEAWHSLSMLFVFPKGDDEGIVRPCTDLCYALEALDHTALPKARELRRLAGETDYQQLCVEFTRLFIGPFQTAAPPYASWYLEGSKLMGESTVQVMNTYIASGVMIDRQFRDLPDHIAAECEFIYYLLSNLQRITESESPSVVGEIQSAYDTFVRTHISTWLPAFCARIIGQTHLPYFRALAAVTEQFVMEERNIIMAKEESL